MNSWSETHFRISKYSKLSWLFVNQLYTYTPIYMYTDNLFQRLNCQIKIHLAVVTSIEAEFILKSLAFTTLLYIRDSLLYISSERNVPFYLSTICILSKSWTIPKKLPPRFGELREKLCVNAWWKSIGFFLIFQMRSKLQMQLLDYLWLMYVGICIFWSTHCYLTWCSLSQHGEYHYNTNPGLQHLAENIFWNLDVGDKKNWNLFVFVVISLKRFTDAILDLYV